MVSNLRFLEHEHFCRECGKEINMYIVKQMILNEMRYELNSDSYRRPVKPTDPFILKDYDNDLELVCSYHCYLKYKHID